MYHVADDEPLTYYEFVKLTADALGVGSPRRIPAGIARVVAGRDPVAAVVRSARTSNERIKRELDWNRGSARAFPDACELARRETRAREHQRSAVEGDVGLKHCSREIHFAFNFNTDELVSNLLFDSHLAVSEVCRLLPARALEPQPLAR